MAKFTSKRGRYLSFPDSTIKPRATLLLLMKSSHGKNNTWSKEILHTIASAQLLLFITNPEILAWIYYPYIYFQYIFKPFMKQNKNFSKVFTFPSSWTSGRVRRRTKRWKEGNAKFKINTGTIHYFLIKKLSLSATKLDASMNKFNYEPRVLLTPQIPHEGIPTRVSRGK